MSANTDNPGLVTGHAKLAQGAVSAAIGNLTGNSQMASTGEQTKQAGIEELKAYQDQHPPTGDESLLERKVGEAVGCEGMVKDGASASASTSSGSTISSDAQTKGAQGERLGGTEQPGLGTGGATPGVGQQASMPERLV